MCSIAAVVAGLVVVESTEREVAVEAIGGGRCDARNI